VRPYNAGRNDIKRRYHTFFEGDLCPKSTQNLSSSMPLNIWSGRTRKHESHLKYMISKSVHDLIIICIQYCKPKTFRGDVNRMPETPWTKHSWQCSQGFRNYQIVVFFFFLPYFPATSQVISTPFPSHHLTYAPLHPPFRTTNVRVNRTRAGHCLITMTDALGGGVISYNQTWVMYLYTYNDVTIRAFEIS